MEICIQLENTLGHVNFKLFAIHGRCVNILDVWGGFWRWWERNPSGVGWYCKASHDGDRKRMNGCFSGLSFVFRMKAPIWGNIDALLVLVCQQGSNLDSVTWQWSPIALLGVYAPKTPIIYHIHTSILYILPILVLNSDPSLGLRVLSSILQPWFDTNPKSMIIRVAWWVRDQGEQFGGKRVGEENLSQGLSA